MIMIIILVQQILFDHLQTPPYLGCICFVLRTGFRSAAQVKLFIMNEGSQEKVKRPEKERALLLLMLCIFATMSSSYVLYGYAK